MKGAILPFQRHSETSADAADRYQRAGKAPTARARVLAAIRSTGEQGATDKELQVMLEMRGSTQRPRRIELQKVGQVVDSGKKRGRSVVWVAAEFAESQLRMF